jgi:hypothetical protein
MTTSNIIVVGFILALLSILSFMLLKNSNKEYPEEEPVRPKFEPRKVTDLSKGQLGMDPIEKPRRKYKKKRKKPVTQVEKRPVGRPKKSE